MVRQAMMIAGIAALLSGCGLSPDKGLFESLVSGPEDIYAQPADVVVGAAPPTGLVDEEERIATMDHLRELAAANASTAAAARPSADELARLRDTHGQVAVEEIEAGTAVSELRN